MTMANNQKNTFEIHRGKGRPRKLAQTEMMTLTPLNERVASTTVENHAINILTDTNG